MLPPPIRSLAPFLAPFHCDRDLVPFTLLLKFKLNPRCTIRNKNRFFDSRESEWIASAGEIEEESGVISMSQIRVYFFLGFDSVRFGFGIEQMGCFHSVHHKGEISNRIDDSRASQPNSDSVIDYLAVGKSSAQRFAFRDLAAATRNFKELIGEGGFGRVFKGRLESGQVVAVKQLNRDGLQGSNEFLVEILMLIMYQHPNLVTLIGYCAEGDERLLVYEYMPKGSLEDHLFGLSHEKHPLDWNTRVKIAFGAAKGLTYLHDVANPPVIYRDMKAANILLDRDFNPKLSDFGLAKLGPVGDNTHVSTRVMGTYGYCAPDYAMSGRLTLKSDVYSFGILLLELITGRRAFDPSRICGEQNLISWSLPFLGDNRRFSQLADPSLMGRYPSRAFSQLVVIASMCLQEQPHVRPIMRKVAAALSHVASQPFKSEPDLKIGRSPPPPSSPSPKAVGTPSRSRNNRRG